MNFANLKVGTRLAIGFICVVALLIVSSVVGILRMQKASEMTDHLIKEKLRNERMIGDWRTNVDLNAVRTVAVFRMADPAAQKSFEEDIKQASARITEHQQALEKRITDPHAKALYEEVIEKRSAYARARADAFKELSAGISGSADKILEKDLMPAVQGYTGSLDKLLDYEKELIDQIGRDIHQDSQDSRLFLIVLTLAAVLFSAAFSIFITYTLLKQLGGEPAYAAEVTSKIADGDLTVHIATKPGDRSSLLYSIANMRDSLADIVGRVRSGTDTMATASMEIARGNLDLSSRTEQQASSLEETASSMEELTSAVKQNTGSAQHGNQLAKAASEVAIKGGAMVLQVVETMDVINDSSKRIADIIGVIDGIAFQTNILALNAAVEAARAGEQGRGFAVVASEVRNLAQRSAAAAKEIKGLIGDSVAKVGAGAKLVDQTGVTMQDIVESIKKVSDVMDEISAASQEQTSGIEQVNQAVMQMDQVTQQNAALVEEAAAAADSLQEQAKALTEIVSVFKVRGMTNVEKAAAEEAPAKNVHRLPAASKKPQARGGQPKRVVNSSYDDGRDWEEF